MMWIKESFFFERRRKIQSLIWIFEEGGMLLVQSGN